MKWITLLALATALIGCQPSTPPAEGTAPPSEGAPPTTQSTDPNNPNATATAQPSGGGDSVGIISPAAGGLSPVTGSDSVVGGGGGGVGSAAKGKAKDIAAGASGRSYSTEDQGGE